jgi:hypothetical protein
LEKQKTGKKGNREIERAITAEYRRVKNPRISWVTKDIKRTENLLFGGVRLQPGGGLNN